MFLSWCRVVQQCRRKISSLSIKTALFKVWSVALSLSNSWYTSWGDAWSYVVIASPTIVWLLEFHISCDMTLTSLKINTPSAIGINFPEALLVALNCLSCSTCLEALKSFDILQEAPYRLILVIFCTTVVLHGKAFLICWWASDEYSKSFRKESVTCNTHW